MGAAVSVLLALIARIDFLSINASTSDPFYEFLQLKKGVFLKIILIRVVARACHFMLIKLPWTRREKDFPTLDYSFEFWSSL